MSGEENAACPLWRQRIENIPDWPADRKRVLLNGRRGDYTLVRGNATRAAGSHGHLFHGIQEFGSERKSDLARARRTDRGISRLTLDRLPPVPLCSE